MSPAPPAPSKQEAPDAKVPDLDASSMAADAAKDNVDVYGSAHRNNCARYQVAPANRCGEYYCGTTQEQIASHLAPGAVCTNAEFACNGQPNRLTYSFYKDVYAQFPDTDWMVKNAMIVERMQSDPSIRSKMSAACTSCYVEFITCADGTCNQVFHACSGLPSPH